MLFEATAASPERRAPARSGNGIDNQQVLEFLRLVEELKQVAALLAIEPAHARSSEKPHAKRLTKA